MGTDTSTHIDCKHFHCKFTKIEKNHVDEFEEVPTIVLLICQRSKRLYS